MERASLAVNPLNLRDRRTHDVCFSLSFGALFVAALVIFGVSYGPAQDTLDNLLANCSSTSTHTRAGQLRNALVGDDAGSDHTTSDLLNASPYLLSSLGFGVLVGVLWMALLRSFAKPVVYGTLLLKGAILMGVGIYLFGRVKDSCDATEGNCTSRFAPLLLVLLGGLYFAWLFCARSRIEMTAALIEQAVVVVSTHPAIFLASAALLLLMVGMLIFSIAALILLVASNLTLTAEPIEGGCQFEYQSRSGSALMYALLVAFLYWSVQLCMTVRFYVISLVTGIWYYENESLAAQEGALSDKQHTRYPVCTALHAAFGKGFGTIAFSSLIVAICEFLKAMARREGRNGGLIGCVVALCIQCILSYIEFMTRFALTFASLTGDALCESGRTFLAHTQRHGLLKVVVIDYLAAMTLNFGAAVLALVVGAITVGLVDASPHVHDDDRAAVLVSVGFGGWLIAATVLLFIAGILLNVVDAAYACLVLDMDQQQRGGAFHRPAIAHAVLYKLKPEYIVQQPAGASVVYARPEQVAPQPATMAVPMGTPVVAVPYGQA